MIRELINSLNENLEYLICRIKGNQIIIEAQSSLSQVRCSVFAIVNCDNEYFTFDTGTFWDGRTQYDLYSEAFTPWKWQKELMEYANEVGILFFSTPFDKTAVDFLEGLNVPAYKIASFEITDIPLIEYIASKGKPSKREGFSLSQEGLTLNNSDN
mgnify:CR=1 FL=1